MKPPSFVRFLSFLSLFFLTGCTSLSVFVANFPTYFDGVKITRDVEFSKIYDLKLDIYKPPETQDIKKQVIVFFYGGSWEGGSKNQYRFIGSAFAKQGYIVVIPDYRKYPDVKFPDFMFDAADATEWVQNNIHEYGVQNPELVIMGHSAGANIATLLITDKSYLKNKKTHIVGGIGLAGAYNFTPNTENLKAIFGPPEQYDKMRPLTFVDGTEPPLFLAYGQKDDIVAQFNFDEMVKKLDKNKVCVDAKLYPDFGHVNLIGQISWVGGPESNLFKDIIKFLNDRGTYQPCFKK